jgi:hypothetical protein
VCGHFGSLEQLRRLGKGGQANEPDRASLSHAHAALATITYAGGARGMLLYIKPTLTGSEPADLVQYHATHADFPQETTVDQYFDEAQWESYRKLGAHIAELLFEAKPAKSGLLPVDLLDCQVHLQQLSNAAE